MDDLISRQAAIDLLRKRLIETANNNVGFTCNAGQVFEDASERIRYWIDELPSVQPQRKTGKWTNRWAQNGDQVKEVRECSECGAAYLRYYDTADGFDCVPPKYCPNCGAKMEA